MTPGPLWLVGYIYPWQYSSQVSQGVASEGLKHLQASQEVDIGIYTLKTQVRNLPLTPYHQQPSENS